jgi:hypothetical protein
MAQPTPAACSRLSFNLRRDRRLPNCTPRPQSTDGPLDAGRCAGDTGVHSCRLCHVEQHHRPALVWGCALGYGTTYGMDRRKTAPDAVPNRCNRRGAAVESRFMKPKERGASSLRTIHADADAETRMRLPQRTASISAAGLNLCYPHRVLGGAPCTSSLPLRQFLPL